MVEDISFETRLIKDVEVQGLERSAKLFGPYLRIIAGSVVRMYTATSLSDGDPVAVPRWSINLELDHLDESTKVKLIIRRLFRVLAHTETTISDLFEGENEGEVIFDTVRSNSFPGLSEKMIPLYAASSSKVIASLRISYTTDTNVASVKTMIKTLAEVDPAADVAWSFLSKGIGVLRKKQISDKSIVGLYSAMFSAHISASHEEVLKNREHLRPFYESLFRQTNECAMFLEGYIAKNVAERPLSARLLHKAAEFQHAFGSMLGSTAQEAMVVTLGVQEFVDPLRMQELLHHLQPSVELGPRSTCLRGTRVKTINTLMAWIAKCDGGVLWCKGTSGSGKSSLMGTLYELAIHASGRNRLGAFIRYDRIENSNSSRLIASIAYSLGMFDRRIGTEISRASSSVSGLLSLSPMKQFHLLLEQPLKNIPSLADEGPLIVIIDGLDECDTSEELLAILAEGFGSSLPFMRLIISSRHLQRIEDAFKERSILIDLDTSSEEAVHDIRFYIDYQFSDMFASLSACDEPNALQELCGVLLAVDGLSKRANASFIWAATACRFLREVPSTSRILALLGISVSENASGALPALYRTILDVIVSEADDEEVARRSTRAVLGALMIEAAPGGMTDEALDTLVLRPGDPPGHRIMAKLGCVAHGTSTGYYRIFHTSFHDFLQNRSQCGDQWYIDVAEHRSRLHKRRLEVLDSLRSGTFSDLSVLELSALL
ncbi:uncharacterized protein ARMOST_15060 [Armillaria ostoyae]|uniref:Nephrocystin 3-like N-terminal domain-containing protein n=1 Tax=Armillaria ostoyae TaxID=47428 RepID=A0A284RSB8_ARMOS|nr:uncharacterized protein ARMOST_15060 [Armillaria ostoyae]